MELPAQQLHCLAIELARQGAPSMLDSPDEWQEITISRQKEYMASLKDDIESDKKEKEEARL